MHRERQAGCERQTLSRDNTLEAAEAEAEREELEGRMALWGQVEAGPAHTRFPAEARWFHWSASGGLAYSPCKPLRAAPTAAGTCGPGQRDGVGSGCTDLVQLGESGTTYFR